MSRIPDILEVMPPSEHHLSNGEMVRLEPAPFGRISLVVVCHCNERMITKRKSAIGWAWSCPNCDQ